MSERYTNLTGNKAHIEIPQCMKIEGNQSSKGAVTLAYFAPGDESAPTWIIKVPRNPSYDKYTHREAKFLTDINKSPAVMNRVQGIPEFVGYTSLGRSQGIIMKPLRGKIMSRWCEAKKMTIAFRLASDWLASFHSATFCIKRIITKEYVTNLTQTYLNPLTQFDIVVEDKSFLEQVESAKETTYRHLLNLSGLPVPISAVHGDFCPHNVLISNEQISGVFDWEEARKHGIPFEDLLHFAMVLLTSRKFFYARSENKPSDIWNHITSYSMALRTYFQCYCDKLKIDITLPLAFLPWYFLITALKDLLPWRRNVKSSQFWLNLVKESIEYPIL